MYLAEVEGEGGINAKLVAYSVSPEGKKIATFELTYHRYIHGEFMTHRLFSRNAMSSRAVPIKRMIEIVNSTPAVPIHWGKNQPGMQAKTLLSNCRKKAAQKIWQIGAKLACKVAEAMDRVGVHKQTTNRLIEPFQMMKTVMTATELDNFFWLRLDEDAQPEIFELARCMRECLLQAKPELLYPGEWHTPYVEHRYATVLHHHAHLKPRFDYVVEDRTVSLEEAIAISSSCCGQVSYRNLDSTYEKAMGVYSRLINGRKVHGSPFEHPASPMEHTTQSSRISLILSGPPVTQDTKNWEDGVTHVDRRGDFWSANFKGWIQHRQLLQNHNCIDYEESLT